MSALKRISATLAAGAMATGIVFSAIADDGRYWMHGMGMMDGWGWGMGGPMMGYGADSMLDYIDGRLAFMKTELKITEAQSAAWDEMASAVRTTAEAHNDEMRAMMEEMHDGGYFKMSLPDRLQFHETHMEARLEQIRTVHEAVDKLYAMLDDEQKKAADDIVLPVMGMGMGMGGMRGGWGRGMMMMRP